MNTETKRHIDSARQVLVGVVPNPASQIDQITYALIYKFMDDMDMAAIKNGDEPAFFTGELERYSWGWLMDTKKGNQEKMNLYQEAFLKFAEAKTLPDLFRNILKDAILPYRSPETLGLFLKEINYFDYSHSEELGNAYEYLLSIMSSQGDAGQFRTPRHIIDFIVEVLNPAKNDKILDPACGTGGFLISSYRHILDQHDIIYNPDNIPLTPDERIKLLNNIEGYDIDPSMVRIAQVNMYLHQFKKPKIYQYDTLSREEMWKDKFDVILANPPFMSPKGGIIPHNKFSIKSSRSEVLFVDYILNHLKPNGRAGIIVPEGIIFQSGSSHKLLRKTLVEDGLYAVVSLPSGVFAPYSGVKTSILFFNKELARQSNEILFVKVAQDGFDLGAKKRPIIKNDMPSALEILNKWKKGEKIDHRFAVWVEKPKIAENGDFNLSGDRYRVAMDYSNAKWAMVELGEVCDLESGSRQKGGAVDKGIYSIGGEQISEDNAIRFEKMKYITEIHFLDMRKGILSKGDVLMVKDGATTGKMGYWDFDYKAAVNEHVFIFRSKDQILPKYLYNVLLSDSFQYELKPYIKGIIGGISLEIKTIKIPLPPLEIQEQIVAELNGYQNIITGAMQIADNWKPKIDIDPKWEKVKLGEVCSFEYGGAMPEKNRKNGDYPVIGSNGIVGTHNEFLVKGPVVVVGRKGSAGEVNWIEQDCFPIDTTYFVKIQNEKNLNLKYLYFVLFDLDLQSLRGGGAVPGLNRNDAYKKEIPLPPLNIQKQIIEKIEAERVLVESAKKLIGIYEQKTKEVIGKVWSE